MAMAVFEQTYKLYSGELTPAWSRFLVIPRHAYRDIFRSKLFTALYALCFVCPLAMAILVYLHYNVNALAILQLRPNNLITIDENFFRVFVRVQGSLGFVLTVIIGPRLVSRDLANNALPLYLCRPFSRAEYVLGKMSVLLILLSSITWIPGLLLFALQSYLEPGWISEYYWIAGAIVVSSLTWSLMVALPAMALSAWVRWRLAASAALFALFTIPNGLAAIIDNIFQTYWGNILSVLVMVETITDGLFHQWNSLGMPAWLVLPVHTAWLGLLCLGALCLWLLARKVRAYEVVR